MPVADRGPNELHFREPGHELFEQNADLHAGQGSSNAEVFSKSKGQASFVTWASQVEQFRCLEYVFVTVTGHEEIEHALAGRDLPAPDLDILQALNDDLHASFERWYPDLRQPQKSLAA